jgi:glycosyltransferase involved in cell wall biosynthesis
MNSEVRLRVLLSAYACEPDKGSEPGVGWNWVCQIARFHEVWVFTRTNNRKSIEAALLTNPLPTVHFVYVDLPLWVSFWKKGRRGIYLYYYLWQIAAYFAGKRLHQQVKFDVVHHVTFVKYAMPSFMALLPVPFVWGPVGGGESAPSGFWWSFSLRGKVFEVLRTLACSLGELDPFVRVTAHRAAIGLATTRDTEARLQALGCKATVVFSQVALPRSEIEWLGRFSRPVGTRPFRAVSVGELLHWKGFELGIRAFAQLHSQLPDAQYWLLGNGPEKARLQKIACQLGVEDAVVFWGELPRPHALEKLAECDVLLHPSLHDSGGWACAEAMAAGLPVICLDLGGPALQVNGDTGFKIPACSPYQAIEDLFRSLSAVAFSLALCLRMGAAAKLRVVEHFNWDEKGAQMADIYGTVAGSYSTHKQVVSVMPLERFE